MSYRTPTVANVAARIIDALPDDARQDEQKSGARTITVGDVRITIEDRETDRAANQALDAYDRDTVQRLAAQMQGGKVNDGLALAVVRLLVMGHRL